MTPAASSPSSGSSSSFPSRFKDLFSSGAGDYARFRPRYPDALFDYLASIAPARELAWDSGTGSGQAAGSLARRFKCVIATDPSRKQLESAEAFAGVGYAVGPADRSPLARESCDLVTAAQAFHWYDQAAFAREARRVLRPGGVVAVWCYATCRISPEIDAVVEELYQGVLGPYWEPERMQVEEGYARAELPGFEWIAAPVFPMSVFWNLGALIGYLGTWSALKKYVSMNDGRNPLEEMVQRFEAAWGDPRATREARWALRPRVARVEG